MDSEVLGNKGANRVKSESSMRSDGEDAMWAVILTKSLWKEQIW
jgi:protein SDA1